jgi:NADH-quinone oxidoreductase subunit C
VSDDETPTVDEADGTDAAEPAEPEIETRYGLPVTDSLGDTVLHADVDSYLEAMTAAHADGFDQLIDLTAVDFFAYAAPRDLPAGLEPQRFEVVVSLIDHGSGERIRVRAQVPSEPPVLPTLFDLWPGAEALEREVFDMFGIEFADHPDMSRILMPETWEGHPLRKDYAIGAIPVQFKAASNIR